MVSPMLLGFVILATLQQLNLIHAALPATNETAPLPNTPDNLSPTLIATANLSGAFNVTGRFQFALQSGTGPVAVSIELNGLNALNASATYTYHIHTNPISSDGNCASALGHLDPLGVTDDLICSPQMSQYCEIGDLAGRNGKLNATETTTRESYIDNYLRFWPQPFSLLGRSIVVHAPNTTRIACGNITSIVDGTQTTDGLPTFRRSNYTTQYPARAPPANPVKYQPFNGTTPDAAVLAQITLPSPLPNVQELPNIILGTNTTKQSRNASATPAPAALDASSVFSYTPGAVLPSQNDPSVNSTNSTTDNSAKKGAQNAAGNFLPSISLINLITFSCLLFI